MQAQNIQEVIDQLERIAERARASGHRAGLFASLYLAVTRRVRDAIEAGRFHDNPRMNRLDTVFANRYLTAYAAYYGGQGCSRSWRVAFSACDRADMSLIQHLLLGMNAHINLDLGLAAAEVCPGPMIGSLEADFSAINGILGGLFGEVEQVLDAHSPFMHRLDQVGHSAEEQLGMFSIEQARRQAWRAANLLARSESYIHEMLVETIDWQTTMLGRLLSSPAGPLDLALRLVREGETTDVGRVIDDLLMLGRTPGPAVAAVPAAPGVTEVVAAG